MDNQAIRDKKNYRGNLMKRHSLNSQRGSVTVMVALTLVMLLSFGALAVDIAYAYVARSEAQNAADTAALNGARFLLPFDAATKEPNWSLAKTEATQAIALNKITNASLSIGAVTSGYWDITSAVHDVHSTKAGVNDLPAIKVTIDKQNNGGPISTFFARIFGVNEMNVAATAVAVVSSPNKLVNKNLFPVAISQCMFDAFWDIDKNEPKLINSPEYPLDPFMFGIGSSYHNADCGSTELAGQWTSLDLNTNNVRDMRKLIEYATGAEPPQDYTGNNLGIGDNIWIQPGVKTTLYDNKNQPSVDACSDSIDGFGDDSCAFVLVPVICPNPPTCDGINDTTNSAMPITGFACLNIIGADGGSKKMIKAKIVAMDSRPECRVSGTGGGSVTTGVWLPPKLANYFGNTY